MNAVIVSVMLMLILSLARMHVMLAMIIAAMVAGLVGGLDVKQTLDAFNTGIGSGAGIALSYALLGGFAVAISISGLPQHLAEQVLKRIGKEPSANKVFWLRNAVLLLLLVAAVSSQNIIPIHIAFIPILVPPLLMIMTSLQVDRRLIACVLTFGLITPYMFLPVGFGNIYLHKILLGRVAEAGLDVSNVSVIKAMAIPALGMLVGLLLAFIRYRKPRQYQAVEIQTSNANPIKYDRTSFRVATVAVIVTFLVQIYTNSMVMGAMAGFLVFTVTGVVDWSKSEGVMADGIKIMASIGFIMIAAAGFAEVLEQTGHIELLVGSSVP